ncbi:MAG: hypothetical protein JSW61_14430 [Candidatus Thorarchaeota archaeon]|nr:MAG: hypothetical protein JSW61_14430 [Candidatus Thorarchaeota archaeon]
MAKKGRALERDRRRLMRVQNPQQTDLRRVRKHQKARRRFWAQMRKRGESLEVAEKEPKREKKKKEKKAPELEVIEEVDSEILDDIDELYSYDEDIEE